MKWKSFPHLWPLVRESIGQLCILLTGASNVKLDLSWCNPQTPEWFVIWDAMTFMCNWSCRNKDRVSSKFMVPGVFDVTEKYVYFYLGLSIKITASKLQRQHNFVTFPLTLLVSCLPRNSWHSSLTQTPTAVNANTPCFHCSVLTKYARNVSLPNTR